MSSSESDAEAPLSESGQESKRSTSSLGCGFIVLAFEEFLVLSFIIAVCRQDPDKWKSVLLQLVAIFVVHVAIQYFLIDQDDPVNVGLEAIEDDLEHPDFEQLFDQLHSAAPRIEHIAVGTKKGAKFVGGGHRLNNQVLNKQRESQVFAFASWRDVSGPVSGRDGPSTFHVCGEHYPSPREEPDTSLLWLGI